MLMILMFLFRDSNGTYFMFHQLYCNIQPNFRYLYDTACPNKKSTTQRVMLFNCYEKATSIQYSVLKLGEYLSKHHPLLKLLTFIFCFCQHHKPVQQKTYQ